MSNCDLVKKCGKCEIISLRSNFHENENKNDGLQSHCISCKKQYYNENRDQILNNQNLYKKENRDRIIGYQKKYYIDNQDRLLNKQKFYNKENQKKINEYIKNRIKTDVNFRLIRNTRRRIHHALNGKSKASSTIDILGIDVDTYRKWIEFQFTPEMNWFNIQIDHVKPICLFDVSNDEELKEAFNWKNTQPLLKEVHAQKGTKFNFLDYQLQFIKAYQFIKLNDQEGFNENIY